MFLRLILYLFVWQGSPVRCSGHSWLLIADSACHAIKGNKTRLKSFKNRWKNGKITTADRKITMSVYKKSVYITKFMCWHRRWAVRAGWGRQGVPSPARRRDQAAPKHKCSPNPNKSPLHFNENFAHRQLWLPRHPFHSSYSINSPSLFSFKENKWCFQPSPFHCLWLISAKHWCWLCLWR